MEKITVGQISATLGIIVALISSVLFIKARLKDVLGMLFKEQLELIDNKIESINDHINKVDLENCKNFLIMFLASLENGDEKTEIEYERFYEEYKHYKDLGGNSYVERRVEQFKAEGKL